MPSRAVLGATSPSQRRIEPNMLLETTHHDLTAEQFEYFTAVPQVAWDIETTGLNWRVDSIGTCQLTDGSRTVIVQVDGRRPERLAALVESGVQKVFHHAMFDLRFMARGWGVVPAEIACTKIAAKILNPNAAPESRSLKSLLREKLGMSISKDQQRSDWLREELSADQLRYAAIDVAYLSRLLERLLDELREQGTLELALMSFEYIPTRVQLDLCGAEDVFTY